MRSHFKPKSWVSFYFSLKTGMFILSAVTYASSLSKAVVNFHKPGPLFWFIRWLGWITSDTAEWSDSGAYTMSHFFANWINSWETKKKSRRHWILHDLVLHVKRCSSLFRLRHISLRLYMSQSELISCMTVDVLDRGFPPLLSFKVSAQLQSPPITIVSSANSSSCWFSLLKKATCWATSLGA